MGKPIFVAMIPTTSKLFKKCMSNFLRPRRVCRVYITNCFLKKIKRTAKRTSSREEDIITVLKRCQERQKPSDTPIELYTSIITVGLVTIEGKRRRHGPSLDDGESVPRVIVQGYNFSSSDAPHRHHIRLAFE